MKTATHTDQSINKNVHVGSKSESFFSKKPEVGQSFFSRTLFQPKLKIGESDDPYEKQADRIADAVVQSSDTPQTMQRKEAEEEELQMKPDIILQRICKECQEEQHLQKNAGQTNRTPGYASESLSNLLRTSRGNGGMLSDSVQSEMGQKIGADFSSVNIHTDSKAVEMSRSIGARAFTQGNDIYFNSGEYNPSTREGKHLLAHELTHVVQQSAGSRTIQTVPDDKHNLTADLFTGEKKLEDAFDGEIIIKLFDKGSAVKKIQQALIQLGFPMPSGDDSMFGTETHKAVMQFQSSSGLTGKQVDGIVGKKTMGLLDMATRHGSVEKDADTASEDFRVKGKFNEKSGKKKDNNPAKIYFDLASAAIDSEEQKKIEQIAEKHKADPLKLIGYASEEGPKAFNNKLAAERIKAVEDKLLPIHFDSRTPDNRSDVGEGKIDYRKFRSVEILTPGEKSAHQSCEGELKDKDCPDPNTVLNSAVDEALRIIKKVLDEQLPPKKTKKSDHSVTFSKLFRNNDQRPLKETVNDVKGIFNQVSKHLENLKNDKSLQRCGTECDGGCAAGAPAYNKDLNGDKSAGRLTMCDSFFKSTTEKQAVIVIHEGHHGTPGIPSSDKAYQNTRLIEKLDHKIALQNAASFHLYAQLVNKPSSAIIGPKDKDVVTITDPNQREQLNLSLAFIEQWFTLNTFDTSSLHAGMDQARKDRRWKGDRAETLMKDYFAPRFGFSKPPTIPSDSEQASVAAIFDRLKKMDNAFGKQFIIEESKSKDEWERGPGQKIKVTPNTLRLNQQRQVIALIQELVHATPDISAELEPEYVILINELRKGRNLDP